MNKSLIATAERAARAAGRIIVEKRHSVEHISLKGTADLVTEADFLSETEITRIIEAAFPEHQIVGEEGGAREKSSEYVWWVDPLDGTTNYAHGYPHYAVSLALEYRQEVILGIVYDPLREELFSAAQGEGAYLNGAGLRVSSVTQAERSLLATGFPYEVSQRPRALELMGKLLPRVQGIRRDGSAALNLAYVAAGRLDGFWEFGLKPWDSAAGALMVREAGGMTSDFLGRVFNICYPEIVAANPAIHAFMVRVFAERSQPGENTGSEPQAKIRKTRIKLWED